jgi:O-antigen/teichoic acid export membrane protein
MVLAHVSTSLSLLVVTPWLVEKLGPAAFGVWITILGAATIVALVDLGTGTASARLTSRFMATGGRTRVPDLLSTALAVQGCQFVVVAVIGWLVAPGAAALMAPEELEAAATETLRLALLGALLGRVRLVFEGVLIGLPRLPLLAGLRTGRSVVFVALVFPLADQGMEAVATTYLLAEAVGVLATAAATRRAFGSPLLAPRHVTRASFSQLFMYGVPRQAGVAGWTFAIRYPAIVTSVLVTAVAAGAVGAAALACSGLATLCVQGLTPLIPSLTALAAHEGQPFAGLAKRLEDLLVGVGMAAAAAFGAICAAAGPIAVAWVGDDLPDLDAAMRYLAPGVAAWVLMSAAQIGGQAIGTPAIEARVALPGVLLTVAAASAGAALFGGTGAVAGTSAGLIAWAMVYFGALRREWPVLARSRSWLPFAIATAPAVFVAFVAERIVGTAEFGRVGAALAAVVQCAAFLALFALGAWTARRRGAFQV